MVNKEIKDAIKGIAPGLEGLNESNPFEVPHDYFNQLPEEILNRIITRKRPKDLLYINLNPARLVWVAVVISMVIGSWFFWKGQISQQNDALVAEEQWYSDYLSLIIETDTYSYYDFVLAPDNQNGVLYIDDYFDQDLIIDYYLDAELYFSDEELTEEICFFNCINTKSIII